MIVGIDPGYKGAIAWLSDDGVLVDVVDMPIAKYRGKTRIVAPEVARLLDVRSVETAMVIIEATGARPGQGVTSMYNFGFGCGIMEGICAAMFLPYFYVAPQTWKRQMGVGADKTACREMAQKLWPGAAHQFRRVKDDGRADAALLARWAVTDLSRATGR